ncbi:hypothetical protein [Guptibacillus hwajinpoensis]|uniref:Uncharacterized protein n=1 Tax=Guptibacillus hwajinpoensis TaxID=208199 RepID=A0A0J6CQS0_9BACL|nr:hypothetical protein [Alkalihalobacillus macyae]KMM38596.1 hypothetical protein AB986_04775 [Alkalihalobacillus macyae]
MGTKISTIELKEVEVIELENNEFETRFVNPKKYPAFLTNRSLATGMRLGITKTSLITNLVQMQGLVGKDGKIDPENISEEQAEFIDADRDLPVIYLGIMGANKSLDLTFEEFLDLYHGDLEKLLNDYLDLVMVYLNQNPNEFRKGLEASTSKK